MNLTYSITHLPAGYKWIVIGKWVWPASKLRKIGEALQKVRVDSASFVEGNLVIRYVSVAGSRGTYYLKSALMPCRVDGATLYLDDAGEVVSHTKPKERTKGKTRLERLIEAGEVELDGPVDWT